MTIGDSANVGSVATESNNLLEPKGLAAGVGEDVGQRVGSDDPVPVPKIRTRPIKIRLIGANYDVTLTMSEPEDFEIAERFLARAKAALGII